MQPKRIAIVLLVAVFMLSAILLLVGTATVHAQCALCRTALESSPEGQAMAAGFNRAILFLLAAPLLIVGSGLVFFWRAARRNSLRNTPPHRINVGSQN